MSFLISIIMPAYKAEDTISESIESVLAQTYDNFELIVIDDSSPDNTKDLVKKYQSLDSRVKLISKEINEGVAAARNTGLDCALGDYVAFLDSDDKWKLDKLEKQVAIFCENPNVDVVYSEYYRFDNDGIKKIVKVPCYLDKNILLKGNCIGNLTGIYNFKKYHMIRQKKIGHEDYLFWLEIFNSSKNVKGIGINEPLAYYRVADNGASLSSNKLKAAQWTWTIYRNHLKLSFLHSFFNFVIYALKAIFKRV